MEFEAVILPPPGLSSDINHNGEQEVSDIRIEFLQGYFGRFSSLINSFTISLLNFPSFVKIWIGIIIKKALKNHL